MTVLAPPLAPYKGLAAFEDSELDALLFFGREREREVIVANLLASRLTVLYGPSGVGKSSILRAAVIREVRELEPLADVILVDEWSGDAQLPEPGGEAFVVLDQFEEYFVYHGEHGPLQDALPELLRRPHVHVLISLREDALARLDVFTARIPDVFGNHLRLDHLDEHAARAAIVGPLERYNDLVEDGTEVEIEPELVDAVLDEVGAAEANGSAPRRIEAPYLQLVLERLWEEEQAARSHVLRLATLRRLGGAPAIVRDHLERTLGALPPSEARIATAALKFLVSPSRTKIAHTAADLAAFAEEETAQLEPVLDRLASQRILRTVAVDGRANGPRYEIFHDVLAEPVLEWRREFEAQTALARQHRNAERRHRRLLLLSGAALLLAAAMAGLAVFALSQRSEARHQATLAVAQQHEAQRQAGLARARSAEARAQRLVAQQQAARARAARASAERAALFARDQQKEAQRQAALAQQQRTEAQKQSALARASEAEARRQAAKARTSAGQARAQATKAARQERRARAGELVATSTALLETSPEQSVRAALSAAGLESTPRVEDALRASLLALRAQAVFAGGGGALSDALFSPDGSRVALGVARGSVRVYDVATHRLVLARSAGAPVTDIDFSPDGRALVAASADGAAHVWSVPDGALQETLRRGKTATAAAFTPDGRWIVTGSAEGTVAVWAADGGALLRAITVGAAVKQVALSPDGSLAAVNVGDAFVRVFRLDSGAQLAAVQQQGEVVDLAFNADGSLLGTAGRRNSYLWDTSTWQLQHLLTGHTFVITDITFTRDGRVLTSSGDAEVRVYDASTGAPVTVLLGQHQQRVNAVAASPDGQQIVTASADGTARVWSEPLGARPNVLAGHTDAVTGAAFSPDGTLVLTWSADGSARLWNPLNPRLLLLGQHSGAVAAVAFSPDGKLVASAGADGSARIWSWGGGQVRSLQHGGRVTQVAFVGADRLLTASEDGTARLWRVDDGALLASFAHGAPVRAAFVDTAGRVFTAGDDGVLRCWAAGGHLLWASAPGAPIAAAAARLGTVATAGTDGVVRIWRAADGRLLHALHGHTGRVGDVAFSPDGRLLVTAGDDTTARVWDTTTGTLLHTLAAHTQRVTSTVFSPDGSLVLTASVDGDARIWSTATGRMLHLLRFHVATVSRALFSPDGRWVVTAGPSAAGLWQTRSGMLLFSVTGNSGALTAAAYSDGGGRFATGSVNGVVATYACDMCGRLPALRAIGEARLRVLDARP